MSSAVPGSPWRAARTAAAAAGSAATAVGVHSLGGGDVTAPVALGLTVAAAGVAWPLTMRRVSVSQLLGLLVLCQAVVHVVAAGQELAVGGVTMLLLHATGTVLTTLALTHGERMAWRVARATAALHPSVLIRRAVVRPVVARVPRPSSIALLDAAHRLRSLWWCSASGVRGPPVAVR